MAKTTGLVLAGAVARGAYEAGALSVILPELERRGESPRVLVGTSAGALNAAFLASRADLGADVATKELVDLWRSIERKHVFRYSVREPAGLAMLELGLGHRSHGLVDTTPLRETLDDAIGSWSRIRANIEDGHFDALAIATTASRTGRTVVFVEGGKVNDRGKPTRTLPSRDDKKGIDYVEPLDGLEVDHVLASAAMPILFPSIRIELGDGTRDWFFDGGLRLNVPTKPALKLGANRVAVVAADPAWQPAADSRICGPVPDIDDYVLHFIQAGLADQLIEDMWTLVGVNTLLDKGAATPDKKKIEHIFVGPRCRGELGCLASDAFHELPWGLTKTLGWLLGRQGSQHHELLSYLLFDPRFFNKAVEQGQADAERNDLRWRYDAPEPSLCGCSPR